MVDKDKEKTRYDDHAKVLLSESTSVHSSYGSDAVPLIFRAPYLNYEKLIKTIIKQNHKVLEVGSGTGLHTISLLRTGAKVTALDISENSLKVLEKNCAHLGYKDSIETTVGDIEQLPYDDNYFDVVVSAGSLSYGDKDNVDSEIHRVLRSSGNFIAVDSLNNNPVYRLNRYVNYLFNNRSKMTLNNMPDIKRVNNLNAFYRSVDINYFGSVSYMMPMVSRLISKKKAYLLSDIIDNFVLVRASGFKFVLNAKK